MPYWVRLTCDPKGPPAVKTLAGAFPLEMSGVMMVSVYTDIVLFVSRIDKSLNRSSQTITKVLSADIDINLVIPS